MNRYSSFAVFLHWIIAIAIFAMLISGWALHYELFEKKQFIFQLFQWHKSIGVTILLLVALRIVWRITHKPPVLPEQIQHESSKIHFGHLLVYALLIIMPLSGWVLVSTNPQGIPTIVFGLIDWLHLPFGEVAYKPAKSVHYYAAFVISAAIVGHIVMAIKHQSQGVQLLERMQATRWVKGGLVLSLAIIGFLSINVFQVSAPAEVKIFNASSEQGLVVENFIQFSGENAGNPFNGTFTEWKLDTDVNIANKSISRFNLNITLNTVATGSSLYDKTLKERDWFDTTNFPTTTFQSSSAEFISDTQVKISGTLTMKQNTIPLELMLSTDDKILNTEFVLKRSELGLGQDSDPDGEWVSEEIQIKAQVTL